MEGMRMGGSEGVRMRKGGGEREAEDILSEVETEQKDWAALRVLSQMPEVELPMGHDPCGGVPKSARGRRAGAHPGAIGVGPYVARSVAEVCRNGRRPAPSTNTMTNAAATYPTLALVLYNYVLRI